MRWTLFPFSFRSFWNFLLFREKRERDEIRHILEWSKRQSFFYQIENSRKCSRNFSLSGLTVSGLLTSSLLPILQIKILILSPLTHKMPSYDKNIGSYNQDRLNIFFENSQNHFHMTRFLENLKLKGWILSYRLKRKVVRRIFKAED